MVNFNGTLLKEDAHFLNNANRGLRYGDSLFEAIRVVNGSIYFLEEHYLRLMSSMRILRMEIPMDFTMEFLEAEILRIVVALELNKAYHVRFTVFRNDGGLYLPETNSISYCIETKLLDHPFYTISEAPYEVELFKDFFVNKDMLSNLKSNNRILNVVGSVFAKENDYHNCLLINGDKMVVEALNGNVFLVSGKTIKTPPLNDGCLNGILRKKIVELLQKSQVYEVKEESISPFELQKADELFITNTISGIIPVYKYRKKIFKSTTSKDLIGKLNAVARLTA
ncbi:MAG: branched-chain amino acid aminotransferase [Maribacter sp.]|jgi:branched-chain amino acid aminotransferase